MSEEHDERTQGEVAQRDPARFADLYEQNFYHVYAYVVRRVGDRHQAEDLTADVFREALAGIQKSARTRAAIPNNDAANSTPPPSNFWIPPRASRKTSAAKTSSAGRRTPLSAPARDTT